MSARFEPLVLCYHAVSARWGHRLAVPPEAIERQLTTLLALRYRPVGAEDLLEGRGRLLHVTFDDAFRSVLEALPVLERLRVPCTVFACSGLADTGRPFPVLTPAEQGQTTEPDLATLDWQGLRELAERGIEVGSHTVTHPHLTELGDDELDRELRDSKAHVESVLGRPCRFLAYPFGDEDARITAAARAAGYEAAFALPGRSKPFDRFAIPRVDLYRKDRLWRFALKTSARRPIAAAGRLR